MTTRTRRPKIDRQEFAKLVTEGWTSKELAEHYGAHIASIQKIRRELQLPAGKRRGKIDRDELLALHHKGRTTTELAAHFGINVDSISRIKNELGITINHTVTPERLAKLTAMVEDGWSFGEIHRTEGADPETLRKYFPGRSWTQEQTVEYLQLRRLETGRHFNERNNRYRQEHRARTHPYGATKHPQTGTHTLRGATAAQDAPQTLGRVIGHAA